MGKKQVEQQQTPSSQPAIAKQVKQVKNSKYNRFDNDTKTDKVDENKKSTWHADAVVYIGHLPHGFYENQLKAYFSQYGQVLGVKVARSRKTSRSKGYAFVQFRYREVAEIVAETMNGYMLMGKVLVSNVLKPNMKNPFSFGNSREYKFINWKRIFMHQVNKEKTPEEIKKYVSGLLKNQQQKKQKLKNCGIQYDYPGYSALLKANKK